MVYRLSFYSSNLLFQKMARVWPICIADKKLYNNVSFLHDDYIEKVSNN